MPIIQDISYRQVGDRVEICDASIPMTAVLTREQVEKSLRTVEAEVDLFADHVSYNREISKWQNALRILGDP